MLAPVNMPGRTILPLLVLFACGDDGGPDRAIPPDASGTEVPAVVPECVEVPQPSADPFKAPTELWPIVPGTLAGWDPDGRWFLTGVRVGGISSYHFARQGEGVIVDGDTDAPGTLDNDVLFQRGTIQTDFGDYTVVKRVSNRAADGTLRAERVLCDGSSCVKCTAKLERATHNASEGESDHLSLVGELNDPTWPKVYTLNVRVAGTLAYLVRRDGLHIIETADPAHPVQVGFYGRPQPSGRANDIKIVEAGAKRYALIGDVPVDIVDVTNPAAPTLAGQIAEEAHTLAVESRNGKTYAYFGNYNARCTAYDVTDPTHPAKLGSFSTPGYMVHDLSIENGIAYLNAWDAGFYAVDFTTPTAPVLVGRWANTPTGTSHSSWPMHVGNRHIALHGEEDYGAHLDVVDIDPTSATFMKSIGSYKTRDVVSIHNIMAFGTKAYFTYYQDGVRVMDLANPEAPALVGYFNTWDPQAPTATNQFFEGAVGIDVDVARKLVFVADSPRGLIILKDETP